MPHPRDHYKWFKKRQVTRNARDKDNEGRFENSHKGGDSDGKGDGKVVNKFNLANSLRVSLVTKVSMNPFDADRIFQDACTDAESKD